MFRDNGGAASGPLFAESLKDPFTTEASTASLPSQLFRMLAAGTTVAGWEFHPLSDDAFHGALVNSTYTPSELN
ncbi:hypothetical protein OAL10_02440 [Gammaproteobacteria bacterium]|nr:hypothetical protein [Gammaproteobacteria bacterium]